MFSTLDAAPSSGLAGLKTVLFCGAIQKRTQNVLGQWPERHESSVSAPAILVSPELS